MLVSSRKGAHVYCSALWCRDMWCRAQAVQCSTVTKISPGARPCSSGHFIGGGTPSTRRWCAFFRHKGTAEAEHKRMAVSGGSCISPVMPSRREFSGSFGRQDPELRTTAVGGGTTDGGRSKSRHRWVP